LRHAILPDPKGFARQILRGTPFRIGHQDFQLDQIGFDANLRRSLREPGCLESKKDGTDGAHDR
jgi:hypothetical protein